jgi:hypothetical protein
VKAKFAELAFSEVRMQDRAYPRPDHRCPGTR